MLTNSNLYLHSPHITSTIHFHNREYKLWRRRRFKQPRRKASLTVRNQLSNQFPFDYIVSSINRLDLVAPAVALVSGVTYYLSKSKGNERIDILSSKKESQVYDVGEWMLFTSPTPFNRFVVLRCPSIELEVVNEVNEKLVKEDKHYVRIREVESAVEEVRVVYQRKCVMTDDGGVISLDWPENLDLSDEHGLDTTIVIVAGTSEGSMDENVKRFVDECVKRGCFPIVVNPRGCSGSPLTTARLFTAADSDDVFTAIQFISKERPWTTLMGVGWGYGANMLTKYLSEVGDKTPLTAATCVDNPFDLEVASRFLPYNRAVDQKFTEGLVDILKSNKELFQGRGKQFDIESALQATCVRDFDKAVSMISCGFEAIEDFYATSSTQGLVDKVKIPLLFIQNDDGTVPIFSIPRSSIAENPYTSLLLCSIPPSSITTSGRSAMSWCRRLIIEWLTAVELGLLKGRHPRLKDVDVNINPSKGLLTVGGNVTKKGGQVKKIPSLPPIGNVNGNSVKKVKEISGGSDMAAGLRIKSGRDQQRNSLDEHVDVQQENNNVINQGTSVGADPAEVEVIPVDSERGQVLQTAEIVMNMLDVTMPNTFTEEKKKKVLTAIGQGETLMQALQDAVPEDVRETLRTAVSGIMQTRSNLKFGNLLNIGHIPEMASGLNAKIQGTAGISSAEGEANDSHSSKQEMIVEDLGDDSDKSQPIVENPSGDSSLESQAIDSSQETVDTDQSQTSDIGAEVAGSGKSVTNDQASNFETEESSSGKDAQETKQKENTLDANSGPELSIGSGMSNSTEDQTVDQFKLDQNNENYKSDMKEDKDNGDSNSADQNNATIDKKMEETPASSSSEAESVEKEDTENQEKEEKVMDPVPDQNSSSPPTFSAFDAFTGIDDSTQAAVNSVFNVIEGMITHLEEERGDVTEVENVKETLDKGAGSVSETSQTSNNKLDQEQENQQDLTLQLGKLDDIHLPDTVDSDSDSRPNLVEQPSHMPSISNGNSIHQLQGINSGRHVDKEDGLNKHLVGTKHSNKYRSVEKVPHDIPRRINKFPYGDPVYSERRQKCLTLGMENTKSLDLDMTATLFLDYFPEEGQWKLLEQSGHSKDFVDDDDATIEGFDDNIQSNLSLKKDIMGDVIEPSYVILDSEKLHEPVEECEIANSMNEIAEMCDAASKEQMLNVKTIVLDSLMVEVSRRLNSADIKEMEADLVSDLEHVSKAASLALRFGKDRIPYIEDEDHTSEDVNTLLGEYIVRAISLAVQDTSYLRKVLPLGVVVGSSLAALRNHFDVPSATENRQRDVVKDTNKFSGVENRVEAVDGEAVGMPSDTFDKNELAIRKSEARDESSDVNNGSVMVGAVTAALGASALLVHQQDCKDNETSETSSNLLKKEEDHHKLGVGEMSEKNENNIVTSLAEKAISVAGPVVPTKDGELDQGRLVAMLAEFGQRGGMLRLVGKAALLWGGIRGALSLIERLMSFLRFAERPLFQRVLGFICLVLVLWTPVVVPLLPTIVQGWASHSSTEIAELACIIGLYVSIMTLIILWGKRIRGYDNPFEQYGLDMTSLRMITNYFYGLIGGVVLVLSIHSVSALIGYAHLSLPSNISTASDALTQLKVYGKMLLLCGKGLVTATGVALVEELLFRSWLPFEIATDLGYHRGIIISGLAFSLSQRSPMAIPGLWLLSLCLSGARQRCQGSLSLPIGIRAGIMASCFILKSGGLLTYDQNFPIWLTGSLSFEPFSGIVGLAVTLLLTMVLYPRRQPTVGNKVARRARE